MRQANWSWKGPINYPKISDTTYESSINSCLCKKTLKRWYLNTFQLWSILMYLSCLVCNWAVVWSHFFRTLSFYLRTYFTFWFTYLLKHRDEIVIGWSKSGNDQHFHLFHKIQKLPKLQMISTLQNRLRLWLFSTKLNHTDQPKLNLDLWNEIKFVNF